MLVRSAVAQIPVSWDIRKNVAAIVGAVEACAGDDLILFPEGALSGYAGDLTPLGSVDLKELEAAQDELAALAEQVGAHLICGSLVSEEGRWWNAALVFGPDGKRARYRKINLAMNERGALAAGSELSVFDSPVDVGIQICREIRFPEQWQHLAGLGAQVFAYLTNAANPTEPPGVWRAHLISRAAENQRWVLAVNAADSASHCPTMIVSPRGEVITETLDGNPAVLRATIDTAAASDWYLGQRRTDIVEVRYRV